MRRTIASWGGGALFPQRIVFSPTGGNNAQVRACASAVLYGGDAGYPGLPTSMRPR